MALVGVGAWLIECPLLYRSVISSFLVCFVYVMLCFPTPIDRDATTNFGREKPAGQTLHHEQTRAPGDADTGSLHSDPIVYPEAEERDGDDLHDD